METAIVHLDAGFIEFRGSRGPFRLARDIPAMQSRHEK